MVMRILIIACLAFSTGLSAEIYRWVDADGRMQFSDRQVPGATLHDVAVEPKQTDTAEETDDTAADDEGFLGPYSAFAILSPTDNETLTKDSGDVPISLLLDPGILEGHRLELEVDGTSVAIDQGITQFKLTSVAVGSHRIRAQIRNADDPDPVARTSLQVFHLRLPQQPGELR